MKSRIVADGARRLHESQAYQARLRELRESIRAKYAAELAEAGFLRRWILRWRMAAEFRRERRRIGPSPHALYARSIVMRG